MDQFEKHIRDNKQFFNERKADHAKIWGNIESQLNADKQQVIPLWKSPLIRTAASVLILLGIAGLVGLSFSASPTTETNYVSQDLQDIDMHYKGLVSYQVQLVQKNNQLSDADKEEFLSFMVELDTEYEQLKLEMQNNLDNEQVLAAIVSNYRKRIELIENLLQQLNESKIKEDDYGYTL
ncbi:hypothetical protein [Maribacter sp. 1_MG-2023]|uniref:hypothetical protein n=1 Tax=Maribacter sp. 1_MG-2023 TaxID=3062677 RepID=UPI0026E244A5|nr:hypothetical protein [Maribacter sp. 1_MG-2023]MDO6473258.1 hypothetical protein [Maribacter sp. 1_MG-2023]